MANKVSRKSLIAEIATLKAELVDTCTLLAMSALSPDFGKDDEHDEHDATIARIEHMERKRLRNKSRRQLFQILEDLGG